MKTDLIIRDGNPIMSFAEYDANNARLMYWSGLWLAGVTYEANEVVTDTGWLMIANKETTDRAAPQTQGPEYLTSSLSPEAPPDWTPNSSNATLIYYGARYTFPDAAFVRGVVFYVPPGSEGFAMAVFQRTDPLGVPVVQNIVPEFIIQADQVDRWITIQFGSILVPEGAVFDVFAAMRPTEGDTSFTYTWDYQRTNGDPPAGFAFHQNNDQSDLRFNELDDGGTDRSTDLDQMTAGSTIDMAGGLTWNVTDVEKIGAVYYFTVEPAARSGNAIAAFTMTYFAVLPIPYATDLLYWSAVPEIQGLISLTGDPDDETLDQTLYGIDLIVQNASISPDWDALASTETGSAAGQASELVTVFAMSWLGQATNGLCTVVNERNGLEVERTSLGNYTLRFDSGAVLPATLIIPVTVVTGVADEVSPELRILDVGVIDPNEILINSGLRNKNGQFSDDDLIQDPANFMAIIGERYS